MNTSSLFKEEKQKRKFKYNLFKKKLSLFCSKRKEKVNLFVGKKKSSKLKLKNLQIKKERYNHNKENLLFQKNRKKSINYLKQSKSKKRVKKVKRHSLVNISKAYSKFKHSIIDSEKDKKKKNISIKNFSSRKGIKRKTFLKTMGSKKNRSRTREKSQTNQSRSKFIDIDKGNNN